MRGQNCIGSKSPALESGSWVARVALNTTKGTIRNGKTGSNTKNKYSRKNKTL